MISCDFILENQGNTGFSPKNNLTFSQKKIDHQIFPMIWVDFSWKLKEHVQPFLHNKRSIPIFFLPPLSGQMRIFHQPRFLLQIAGVPFPLQNHHHLREIGHVRSLPLCKASQATTSNCGWEDGTSADPSTVAGAQCVRNCRQRPGPGNFRPGGISVVIILHGTPEKTTTNFADVYLI